ncbi:hypothetical protein NF27_AZ00010 [Candidatus Jidaibacter acanthamoeba]|uniref:HTH cro/C1-type domain-containing protein n=1 Tax=Candidatus Jidaibacter acanthamoebae TaxID=86105 RepID=A0A0C1N1F6_9RICK|nr:transcriptional regulator [Candidatus Jidaibacter acanthamoeba]KIE06231.1 hypothetical protein NF27_AZ00010 [Candidatus Jidaibacter acanthamoeba]
MLNITIKPIKNLEDYRNALNLVEQLWDAEPDTLKGDQLDILVILIERYEEIHFPIESPDPIEAIKFIMEQKSLTKTDLARILGSSSRASEILSKKRKLSLKMIRSLHDKLHIPYEILASEYNIPSYK